jgi:hypothetical protein
MNIFTQMALRRCLKSFQGKIHKWSTVIGLSIVHCFNKITIENTALYTAHKITVLLRAVSNRNFQNQMLKTHIFIKEVQIIKGTPPPLFSQFSDLKDDKAD